MRRLGYITALLAAAGISIPIHNFHADTPHAPVLSPGFGRGKKTKNSTGGRVTQRQLRRRWEDQGGNAGRGKYVMIAGRVRNMKKLTGRC